MKIKVNRVWLKILPQNFHLNVVANSFDVVNSCRHTEQSVRTLRLHLNDYIFAHNLDIHTHNTHLFKYIK